MRVLITALLVAAFAFAPAASAQTAGPSVPTGSALDGEFKANASKRKPVHRVAKKRVTRHTVRKARAVRAATKAKAAPRRAPARTTAMSAPGAASVI